MYRYGGPPLPTRAHETFLSLYHALASSGHDLGSVKDRWTLFDCAAALGVGIEAVTPGVRTEREQVSLLRRRVEAAQRGETLPETVAAVTSPAALGIFQG